MASADSSNCQPASFEHPIFLQCLDGIRRAGRVESADWAFEKTQFLISFYQKNKNLLHLILAFLISRRKSFSISAKTASFMLNLATTTIS